jgi:hypothetical protein
MTVVTMSSLFSFQSSSSSTSFEVQAFLVSSLVGRLAGSLLGGGVFESLTLVTEEPLGGVNGRSLTV